MAQLLQAIIDTQKNNYRSIGQVNAGDNLELELIVKMDGKLIEFNAPEVELLIKKSDKNRIRQLKDIVYQDGKFKIVVDEQGTTCPGIVTCQLVTKEDGRVSTCLFYLMVGTSLDREVLQSISKVEILEQLDEYVATAFANLDEYEKRILAGDETIRKLNNDINEAEKIRNAAENKRQELFEAKQTEREINYTEAEKNRENRYLISEEDRNKLYREEAVERNKLYYQEKLDRDSKFDIEKEERKNDFNSLKIKMEEVTNNSKNEEDRRAIVFTDLRQAMVENNNTMVDNEAARIKAEENRSAAFEKIKTDNTSLGTSLTKKVDDKIVEIEGKNTTFKEEINEQFETIVKENKTFKEELNGKLEEASESFYGKKCNTLDERIDYDVNTLQQQIYNSSLIEYTGENVKADNSYYGLVEDLEIEAKTLQNLCTHKTKSDFNSNGTPTITSDGNIRVDFDGGIKYIFIKDFSRIKPSTTYTICMNVVNSDIDTSIRTNIIFGGSGVFKPIGNGTFEPKTQKFLTTSRDDFTSVKHQIDMYFGNGYTQGFIEFNIVILEGDYTNIDLPYFEGIKSVGELVDGKYEIGVKSYGKNLMSDGIELGLWNFYDKIKNPNTKYARSKKLEKCKPNTNYVFSGSAISSYGGNLAFYDKNKKYLGNDKQLFSFKNFTTPPNAYFILFHIPINSVVNIDGTIQLEEGTIATPYEPYQESTVNYQLANEFRGIPNGAKDTIDKNGLLTRRVDKVVLDGNATMYEYRQETYNPLGLSCFRIMNVTLPKKSSEYTFSDWLVNIHLATNNANPKECFSHYYDGTSITGNIYITLKNVRIGVLATDDADQKYQKVATYLANNPLTIYYELDEPITEQLTPKPILKSYEGVTHISSTNDFKPNLKCKVSSNVQALLQDTRARNVELENELTTTKEDVQVLTVENEDIKVVNENQDLLIDTTMLAADEMYMMIEPLLSEVTKLSLERSVSKMVDMYVAMVMRGLKTIEQVPARYREEVAKILAELEK